MIDGMDEEILSGSIVRLPNAGRCRRVARACRRTFVARSHCERRSTILSRARPEYGHLPFEYLFRGPDQVSANKILRDSNVDRCSVDEYLPRASRARRVSRATSDLTGRAALVTVTTRGTGMVMAGALAASCTDSHTVSSTMGSHSPVVAIYRCHGRPCTPHECDVTNRDDTRGLADWMSDRGALDILISNTGTISCSPAAEHDDAHRDQTVELDLTSPFFLTREDKHVSDIGSRRVLVTASLLGSQGRVNVASRAAAESGIAGPTCVWAIEWAPPGITVNAIDHGHFETENTRSLREDPRRSEVVPGRIPAGRWGDRQVIVGNAVIQCSSASAHVKADVNPVDGVWLGR